MLKFINLKIFISSDRIDFEIINFTENNFLERKQYNLCPLYTYIIKSKADYRTENIRLALKFNLI